MSTYILRFNVILANHITKYKLPGCTYGALLIIFCIGVRKGKQSTWENKSTYLGIQKHSSGITDWLIIAVAAMFSQKSSIIDVW